MADVPVLVTVDLIYANMHSIMADVPVLVTVDLICANMHLVMGDVPVLVTADLIYANMHSVMGVSYSFHCCNCLHASLTLSLVLIAVT